MFPLIKFVVVIAVILIILFLVLLIIRSQWKMKIIATGIITFAIISCGIYVYWHLPRSFSSREWKNLGEQYRNGEGHLYDKRRLMLDDLLKKYSFSDLSKEEIISLLGASDTQITRSGDLVYNLSGYSKLWPFPSDEVLIISIDKNGLPTFLTVKGSENGNIIQRKLTE